MPRIERREREIVPVLKLLPVEMEFLSGIPARVPVPPVRQNHTANVPEQRRNFRQVRDSFHFEDITTLRFCSQGRAAAQAGHTGAPRVSGWFVRFRPALAPVLA